MTRSDAPPPASTGVEDRWFDGAGQGRQLDGDQWREWLLDLWDPAAPDREVVVSLRLHGVAPNVDLEELLAALIEDDVRGALAVSSKEDQPYWERGRPRFAIHGVEDGAAAVERLVRLATDELRRVKVPGQPVPLTAFVAKVAPGVHHVVLAASAMVDGDDFPRQLAVRLVSRLSGMPTADGAGAEVVTVDAIASWWRRRAATKPGRSIELDRRHERWPKSQAVGAAIDLSRLSERIADMAVTYSVSCEAVVLAAYALVLRRLGGRPVPIGVRESSSRLGLAVVDTSGRSSVYDLVRNAHAEFTGATRYAVPISELRGILPGAGDPARPMWVRSGFRVARTRAYRRGPVTAWMRDVVPDATVLDIDLVLAPGAAVGGRLLCRSDSMSSGRTAAIAGQIQAVLEQFVADPSRRVADIDTMSATARTRILDEWSNGGTSALRPLCVHQLIDEQAARSPDREAVVFDQQRITYAQLVARANQLANHLTMMGIRPDERVSVLLHRSFDLVIALLAVLKAGGAYVPLDPALAGVNRMAGILTDADCKIMITTSDLLRCVPVPLDIPCICLDVDSASIDEASTVAPINSVGPHNLAYVIYTSGSTGRPKGVMVAHRSLVNYLQWSVATYLRQGSGAPVLSSISFDLTVSTLFAPLVAGQPVVLAPSDADFEELSDLLSAHAGLGFVKVTPTHLDMLRRVSGQDLDTVTSCVVVGGEGLVGHVVDPLLRSETEVAVYNEYGPTEGCVANVAFLIRRAFGDDAVPIGRPIPNTEVYVLDHALRLVPAGEAGEIYIAGSCLARGYLANPAATAERFLPHPFKTGARIYRTGDRGMWLPSGDLVYRGRADEQIKIRGNRIEPGEIEAALRRHPAIADGAVTASTSPTGALSLVAHIVPTGQRHPTSRELRQFLSPHLPIYMVPPSYHVVTQLPTTGNGKVDRASLVRCDCRSAPPGAATPLPAHLQPVSRAFEEILGVARIGGDDDFFVAGGDSRAALQLIGKVRELTGVKLPLRAVFEASTPMLLAEVMESVGRTGDHELIGAVTCER